MANIDYKKAYFDAIITAVAPTCNGYVMMPEEKDYQELVDSLEELSKDTLTGNYEEDVEAFVDILEAEDKLSWFIPGLTDFN